MVVLSPDILPEIRMTVDEYLAADLPEGYRYELVEGEVCMAPPPEMPHDSVIEALTDLFGDYKKARPDIIAKTSTNAAVTVPGRDTAREPDFAVYSPEQMGNRRGKTWKNVTPMLVVEVVSPCQAARDYEDKRRDYWDAGVGAYWIFDMSRGSLTVLDRGPSGWIETRFGLTQTYCPPQFPGLEISVGRILDL